MGEEMAHEAKGFGKVVAVRDPFIDGQAELDRVAQVIASVLIKNNYLLLIKMFKR